MKNAKTVLAACLLSLVTQSCASGGLVLNPKESDVRLGSRNYHFANELVGLDFYFLKSDEELGVADSTSVFIDNRTKFPMTVMLSKIILSQGIQKIIMQETVPPFGQGVVSTILPYGEWLILQIGAGKNYVTRIKLEP